MYSYISFIPPLHSRGRGLFFFSVHGPWRSPGHASTQHLCVCVNAVKYSWSIFGRMCEPVWIATPSEVCPWCTIEFTPEKEYIPLISHEHRKSSRVESKELKTSLYCRKQTDSFYVQKKSEKRKGWLGDKRFGASSLSFLYGSPSAPEGVETLGRVCYQAFLLSLEVRASMHAMYVWVCVACLIHRMNQPLILFFSRRSEIMLLIFLARMLSFKSPSISPQGNEKKINYSQQYVHSGTHACPAYLPIYLSVYLTSDALP